MPTPLTSQDIARALVLDHGHLVDETPEGVLMGGILWGKREEDGTYTTGYDWSPVPLDLPGLRDWLGY